MTVDVAPEILIDRPRSVVAAYMFDPAYDLEWTNGIVACRAHEAGLMKKGSRIERTSRFLGREFSYEVDVEDADGDSFVSMRVSEPFPMRIRYELEDAGGKTRARIRAKGEASGFFKLAGPLLSRMVERSIRGDLEKLKEKIEARPV